MRDQTQLTSVNRRAILIVVSERGSTKATQVIRSNGLGGLLHVLRVVRSHGFPYVCGCRRTWQWRVGWGSILRRGMSA